MVMELLDFKKFGEGCTFYRKKMRLTPKEVFRQFGIPLNYVSKIEKGNTPISLKLLVRCCNAFMTDIRGCEQYDTEYERILEKQFKLYAQSLNQNEQRLMLRIMTHIVTDVRGE